MINKLTSGYLILSLATLSVAAQTPLTDWENTIGGTNADSNSGIIRANDLGFILAGVSQSNNTGDKTELNIGGNDFWIVKLDSAGIVQWDNTIGSDDNDYLEAILPAPNNEFLLAGTSYGGITGDKSTTGLGSSDFWLLQLDSSGSILWQKGIGTNGSDGLDCINTTADGGYIIGSSNENNANGDKSQNNIGGDDFWAVKIDSLGIVEWDKTIGGTLDDIVNDIIQTDDGGYVLAGTSISGISGDKTETNLGGNDFWIVKLDASGNLLWQNTIGGNLDDYASAVIEDYDGNIFVSGKSNSGISGDKTTGTIGPYGYEDVWLIKLNASGDIIWDKTYGGNNEEFATELYLSPDSSLLMLNMSTSDISGNKTENSMGSFDYWVLNLSTHGDILWQNVLGGSQNDTPSGAVIAIDGGWVVSGTSPSGASGDKSEYPVGGSYNNDYWAIKMHPSDCIIDTYYLDSDGDGFGNNDMSIIACSLPIGYVHNHADCDDSNDAIFPFNVEICNGLDDNCNGDIDEDLPLLTLYADVDGDGYGSMIDSVLHCSLLPGYASNNDDCNDLNDVINPDAMEICNGLDDNCNGFADEGLVTIFFQDADLDGFGNAAFPIAACSAPIGYADNALDCNDDDNLIFPGSIEVCNGQDDNCDGYIDEGIVSIYFLDYDNDGYGDADSFVLDCTLPLGYSPNNLDCDDLNDMVHPGMTETCNYIDDDCDGSIDDELTIFTLFIDSDGDSFGDAEYDTISCFASIFGYVADSDDCDDSNADIYPGAIETENGLDDNCDGNIDEDLLSLESLDPMNIEVFPNPNFGNFTIQVEAIEESAIVDIFDLLGQQVIPTFTMLDNTQQVDLPETKQIGMFILKIQIGDDIYLRQLIIL
jgi:hypothetical protein